MNENKMTLLTGNKIEGARLLTLRAMLQLEMKGRTQKPNSTISD